MRRENCSCIDAQRCLQCEGLHTALAAVVQQMTNTTAPVGGPSSKLGAYVGSQVHLLCCPACPGPAMLAPAFLQHLQEHHLAPVGDSTCSQCASKVYGMHFISADGNLHCLGCAFCVLNGNMAGLPDGWAQVPGGAWQGPPLLGDKGGRESEVDAEEVCLSCGCCVGLSGAEEEYIKHIRGQPQVHAQEADTWRQQMCLPLHCTPAEVLAKPAVLDALLAACRMDGRVDMKLLSSLSVRPCPWWLDLLSQVGGACLSTACS